MLAASAAVVVAFSAASCTQAESPTPVPTPAVRHLPLQIRGGPLRTSPLRRTGSTIPTASSTTTAPTTPFTSTTRRQLVGGQHVLGGHSTSKDLVHWEQQPVAMEASPEEEIFSGCIVMDKNNASGLGSAETPPPWWPSTPAPMARTALCLKAPRHNQSRSAWTTGPRGRSIRQPGPEPCTHQQQLPRPENHLVRTRPILGDDHRGCRRQVVKLFKSTDLLRWEYLSDFSGVGAQGGLWEVPELLHMDVEDSTAKKWVMLLSINPRRHCGRLGYAVLRGRIRWKALYGGKRGSPPGAPLTESQWLDHGADYYAANSISGAPGGDKPVLLGWMGNWDYARMCHHPVARLHGYSPPRTDFGSGGRNGLSSGLP